MHFHNAYIKLTLFYVIIVMTISISFSVIIFNIAARELNSGLGRQLSTFRKAPPNEFIPDFEYLEKNRLTQLQVSANNLLRNLIIFNILILLTSAGLSYIGARRTLLPIAEATEEQNRFTADASHELRTPLTAMKTEIEVGLRDHNLSLANAKKLLTSNLEEISKLESLSSALLKLSRNDKSENIKLSNISLDEVITDAYSKIEKLAEKKNISFVTNLKNIKIKGDFTSLSELFMILLDNAIKYSNKNSQVTIKLHEDKTHATVELIDSGIGIKASDLPHIFSRFYRADHSRNKEKIDGYGLGLSIAKQIVELNKGTISVSSRQGSGTKFVLKFLKSNSA